MDPSRRFIVTPTLVAMNVVILLAMVSLGVSPTSPQPWDLLRFGANFGGYTAVQGEWWRLLASAFLHYGIIHLGFNMWCLWALGNLAERMFGNSRFLVIYLLTALGGSVGSLLWHPYVISAGASGAVFGIAGALASFLYLGHIHLPPKVGRELLTSVVFFIGINLVIGASIDGIDNAGHLGGLFVGALLGAALRHRVTFYAAVGATLIALVGVAPAAKRVTLQSARVFETEALILTASGDREGALAKLEAAIERDATLPYSFMLAAQIYVEDARYDDAVRVTRRALELDPELEQAKQVLATALYLGGHYEEAIPELRALVEANPKELNNYFLLSRTYLALDRGPEAIAVLEDALTWKRDTATVKSELGILYLELDETDRAVASLREAVALEPRQPEHYNRLSLVLAVAGRHDEALEAVEKALALAPNTPHILDSLGTVRFYRRELDLALAAYREAIGRSPDEAVYYYNESVVLRAAGDEAAADAAFAEALRLDPGFEPPRDGGPKI